jgi:ribose transport system permease protein
MFELDTNATLVLIVLVLFLALSVTADTFMTIGNLSNLLRQTSINGIVALGMLLVIITGGIDLSVGATIALTGMVSTMMVKAGIPIPVAILASVAIGVVVGLANGILIFDFGITPFIATLGTMTIVRGLVMIISDARMVSGLPENYQLIANAEILVIPSIVWIWAILFLLTALLLRYTQLGRNMFIIGSSAEVARLSGIRLRRNTYAVYMLCGLATGIAGVLLSSRLSMGVPTAGTGYELDAIAAVVIGGGSLLGAAGTALGALLGAVIMQTIHNGGNLLGIDPFALQVIIGALILLSVGIDQMRQRRKASA